jgi:hypothetical protein
MHDEAAKKLKLNKKRFPVEVANASEIGTEKVKK